jgi:hypothetical protein
LDRLRLVPIKLTISQPEDADLLKSQGISGLRKDKLQRLANEACDRGGLLVREDLALLLTTSTRTSQRDMKELREQETTIPTRGSIQDIGPTVPHKTKIIELYLKGYEYTEIEQRTRHTGDASKRYISGFSKVILLSEKEYSPPQIRELTSQSEKVVYEYLALYATYKETGKDRIIQITTPPSEEFDTKKGGRGSRITSTAAGKGIESAIKQLLTDEYKFLGGERVQEMLAKDIIQLFKRYTRDPWSLDVGQTLWFAVGKDEKPGPAKTLAKMRITPVVLSVTHDEDKVMRAHDVPTKK